MVLSSGRNAAGMPLSFIESQRAAQWAACYFVPVVVARPFFTVRGGHSWLLASIRISSPRSTQPMEVL